MTRTPVKMLVDGAWLTKHVETDPDLDCEVRPDMTDTQTTVPKGEATMTRDELRAKISRELHYIQGADGQVITDVVSWRVMLLTIEWAREQVNALPREPIGLPGNTFKRGFEDGFNTGISQALSKLDNRPASDPMAHPTPARQPNRALGLSPA
jgi:hypothetical protein